jgi:hypothetical protein
MTPRPLVIQWEKNSWLLAILVAIAGASIILGVSSISPKIAIVISLAPLGGLAILRYPFLGMIVLTFLLPLERMQRFTDDSSNFTISLMRLVALASLGVLIVQRYMQRRTIRLDLMMILYGVYVLFAIVSIFHTTDLSGTKRALGTTLSNCLFFLLYFNYLEKRKHIYLVLVVWIAANILAATYSAYDWHLGSGRTGGIQTEIDPGAGAQTTVNRWSTVWEDRAEWESLGGMSLRRSMGPTSHAAVYGINMIMAIPLFFVGLNYFKRSWQQIAIWGCLALLGYNILLTNTRAVILQAAITGVLCITFGLFKILTVQILFGLIGLASALPLVPKDIYNRILTPSNYSLKKSAAMRIRIEYWKASTEIIADKWLTGVGVGNENEVPKHVKTITAKQSTVHNTFIQFLLEVGIFGWIIFYSFVGLMLFYARKASQYFRTKEGWKLEADILVGIQISMISVLIFGLQVDVFLFPLKGWWLLSVIGLVLYRWAARDQQNLPLIPDAPHQNQIKSTQHDHVTST